MKKTNSSNKRAKGVLTKKSDSAEKALANERFATVQGVWSLTVESKGSFIRELFGVRAHLSSDLLSAVVAQYLDDRRAYIERNKIEGRILRYKAAGLMAARIVRVRPVQIFDATDHCPGPSSYPGRENEALAIANGIAICAEGATEAEIQAFMTAPHFKMWWDEFMYTLTMRHDCAETCCLAFATISLAYFPRNMDHTE
jgi:hypothetical protein